MKVIVLQGIPASGKSTWAREFVKDKKDWVIISRDSIREGTGMYWCPEREDYITAVEDYSLHTALSNGLNVIIDDINLNPKTVNKWKEFVKTCKPSVELELKKFNITLEEALERDSKRERPVGEKTILEFFEKYCTRQIKEHDSTKKDVVVCDLDGTVALHNNRSPYDLSKVLEDTFDPRMKRLLTSLSETYKILFVTGREGTEQCRKDTLEWITSNFRDPACDEVWELFMRKEGDYRKDVEVKEEIYENDIEPYYNVITAFDDRDSVVKMWREKGILCSQVYYGNF